MNKLEAIAAMLKGQKVAHKWFTPDEWMMLKDGKIVFEDGNQCTEKEFWCHRVDESWESDWRIWK